MIVLDNPEHAALVSAAATVTSKVVYSISRECADGRCAGGVVFTNYNGASVHVHVAGFEPNWLSSSFLWVMFDYGFRHLGCNKIIGMVSTDNPKALEFDLKVGFNVEARIEGYYRDGDLVILSMKRNDCRWLRHAPKNLQVRDCNGRQTTSTSAP